MRKCVEDVRAFHEACGVPCVQMPGFPSHERVLLRRNLVQEEYAEFQAAVGNRDMVDCADAIADLIYVLVGTALEFGIPLERVWREVHRANMAKVDPITGLVRRRDDGKILKPEGWTAPNVVKAVYGVEL